MITNHSDISLALAVWLLHDEYDHQDIPNYISATSMMKPIRHLVLGPRVPPTSQKIDVEDFIPTALGKSLHDSIEKAWTTSYATSLAKMGYGHDVIERVKINPTDEERRGSNSMIPVFLEQRMFREFEGFTIGGKFDLVTEGIVQDAKSTSAYSWVFGGKDDDYQLQMSLYRWIDSAQPFPKITEDVGRINFIFTDWQRAQARQNPKYPQKRVEYKEIPLLSLKETEAWVHDKLQLIQRHRNTPEDKLPLCTDEELWLSDPTFKYYADPAKTSGRSTKNFDSMSDARNFQSEKGGKGVIITTQPVPKRCGYCNVFSICSQKDGFNFQ
ncbi:PD-(D/E)XK nuclease family protein [Roseococcus sp.]|uniref:PD-(D/E)XK nuclease family protein n=1 Tax=Roseococcus sp. TaxID=2109646 RepID=UPI003BAD67F3